MRDGLVLMLTWDEMTGPKAATTAGVPCRTLQRILKRIMEDASLVRGDEEETLRERLSFARMLEFDELGNPLWNARCMFNSQSLDFFASSIELYASASHSTARPRR